MSAECNPFLIYGYDGPDYFCDRKAETEQLMESLKNGCNVTLMGPRRLGKTGLIKNVFHYLQEQDITCFYIDIYASKNLNDFVELLGKEVIGKLDTPTQKAEGFITQFFRSCKLTFTADPFSMMPQVGLEIEPKNVKLTLDEIFAYIAQSKRKCVIAIDEFQQIAEYDDIKQNNVEAILRTYAQQLNNVKFVFSGSKLHVMSLMFDSPKHPFYRSTERQHIAAINKDTYYQFAQDKLKSNGITLPKEVFDSIYNSVDGVTWYIQKILNHLFRVPERTITEQDVQNCVRDIILTEAEDYNRLLHLLTANQVKLLTAIAKEKVVKEPMSGAFIHKYRLKSSSSVQRAFEYLIKEEYICQTDDGYIVYDRFMAIWMRSAKL